MSKSHPTPPDAQPEDAPLEIVFIRAEGMHRWSLGETLRERGFSTARDVPYVFIAMDDDALTRPSRWDFSRLIALTEQVGGPLPSVLAWLIRQCPQAYATASILRQTAVDIGSFKYRGRGVLFAAHVQEDIETMLDAPEEFWIRPMEVLGDEMENVPKEIPETIISALALRMLNAEIERHRDDEEFCAKLESVRAKVLRHAADDETVAEALKNGLRQADEVGGHTS